MKLLEDLKLKFPMKEVSSYGFCHIDKRFRFDKCVVCGLLSVGRTGYLFMQNGKNLIGIPFCQKHLDQAGLVFANPVFENEEALRVFKEKHPAKYAKYVRGKQIIFLSKET